MAKRKVNRTESVECHLYKVAYKMANGQSSVYYKARFRAWNGASFDKRLSNDLQVARGLLKRYEAENDRKHWPLLLEEEKTELARKKAEEEAVEEAKHIEEENANAMTVAKWLPLARELPEMKTVVKGIHKGLPRRESTLKNDAFQHGHLSRLLDAKRLDELKQADLEQYRSTRLSEKTIR